MRAITGKIDLYNRDERSAALESAGSTRSKAETIASNIERVLEERIRHEDPALYKRFSAMIRDVIEQMRSGWLAAADALKRVEEVEEEVIRPKASDVPELVRRSKLATVLFRNTLDLLGEATAEAAVQIDKAIQELAIVGWKDNEDRQKLMRQAIDDYLFELDDERSLGLSTEQIDAVIDTILDRAKAVMP